MAKNPQSTEPTKAELEILSVLWENGPCTVRFVHEQLNTKKGLLYTSTLKQMQVMTGKGLLSRDESQMKHVYKPVAKQEKIKEHLLGKLLDRFYKGSSSSLIMQLLGNKRTSKEDIEFLKEQLRKMK